MLGEHSAGRLDRVAAGSHVVDERHDHRLRGVELSREGNRGLAQDLVVLAYPTVVRFALLDLGLLIAGPLTGRQR